MKLIKDKKKGFTLVELMISIAIFGILLVGVKAVMDQVRLSKMDISLSGFLQSTLNDLDRKLQININNADRIIYPNSTTDFCEGLSGWTIESQNWWPEKASLNDQNLDKKGNVGTDGNELPWYTLVSDSGKWVMFCDENGKINFIGLAKKYIPKKNNEYYTLVHYVNRRVEELIPTDNVSVKVRDNGSKPTNNAEQIEFIAPLNIGIYDMKISYPFDVANPDIVRKANTQKSQSYVDFNILFETSSLTAREGQKGLYRYFRTLNLRTLDSLQ